MSDINEYNLHNYSLACMVVLELFGNKARGLLDDMPYMIDTSPGTFSRTVIYTPGGTGQYPYVVIRDGAPVMEWLHEVSHYLSWVWFREQLIELQARGDLTTTLAETLAFIPHAVLEEGGREQATIYLYSAAREDYYFEAVQLARSIVARNQSTTIKKMMRGLVERQLYPSGVKRGKSS